MAIDRTEHTSLKECARMHRYLKRKANTSLVWRRHDLADRCFVLTAQLPDDIALVDADEFKRLWDAQPERTATVRMYDKVLPVPRKQCTFERPYQFSGQVHQPDPECPMPEYAKRLREWLRANLTASTDAIPPSFDPNQCLANWYATGENYIGAHSNDDRQAQRYGANKDECYVVTTSHGATRTFRIRDKSTKKKVLDIQLCDNMICVMGGRMQREFTHEIVKATGKNAALIGRRISITFRHFVDDDEDSVKNA